MSYRLNGLNGLNIKSTSYIPSKAMLEKIESKKIEDDLNVKTETVYFDNLEAEWWQLNKCMFD